MSSRVLRKLQGDKDLTEEIVSDVETDLPVSSGARRKQLNVNRYDLLNQQSHSESEVKEDDNETEAATPANTEDPQESTKRKKKKKKKKSGKSMNTRRSSEDNVEIDEVERSVREVNKLLGETDGGGGGAGHCSSTKEVDKAQIVRKGILNIQHRNLNANNELKRIFGSRIIQPEQNKRRGRGRVHLKTTWLVTAKDNWPQVGKPGLSMSLVENKKNILTFTYEHNFNYQLTQMKFLEAVESLNPDNIVAIINDHPYHVDTLIQLSDLCKMSDDLAMAAELIERALFCLECAFHPLFNIAQGNCRLDYRRQENRALFIALFKHLIFVGDRACYRTALEFCKLLLSLDPEGDPLGIILAIDFYALRAREYKWLLQLFEEWENWKNLSQLPNFAFSIAITNYYLTIDKDKNLTVANQLLQNALITFPGVLMPLLEKCCVQPDSRVASHSFFGPESQNSQTSGLTQLIRLYVCRGHHIWKEGNLLTWLEENVNKVLDRVDANDPFVKECATRRATRYVGTPRNILRHILLSDFKEVTASIQTDTQGPVLSFDPLPPPDSINVYTRPRGPRVYQNSSAMSMFFQSLLPNFNINEPASPANDQGGVIQEIGAEDLGEAGASGVDLRRSVTSLLDAMRDLLSNIRLPDGPNDADVDDDDESETDEEMNNYLT